MVVMRRGRELVASAHRTAKVAMNISQITRLLLCGRYTWRRSKGEQEVGEGVRWRREEGGEIARGKDEGITYVAMVTMQLE